MDHFDNSQPIVLKDDLTVGDMIRHSRKSIDDLKNSNKVFGNYGFVDHTISRVNRNLTNIENSFTGTAAERAAQYALLVCGLLNAVNTFTDKGMKLVKESEVENFKAMLESVGFDDEDVKSMMNSAILRG